jgi:hypothetical protein
VKIESFQQYVTGFMDGKQLRLCMPICPAIAERTSERNLLLLLASGVQGEESGEIRCMGEKKMMRLTSEEDKRWNVFIGNNWCIIQ